MYVHGTQCASLRFFMLYYLCAIMEDTGGKGGWIYVHGASMQGVCSVVCMRSSVEQSVSIIIEASIANSV